MIPTTPIALERVLLRPPTLADAEAGGGEPAGKEAHAVPSVAEKARPETLVAPRVVGSSGLTSGET